MTETAATLKHNKMRFTIHHFVFGFLCTAKRGDFMRPLPGRARSWMTSECNEMRSEPDYLRAWMWLISSSTDHIRTSWAECRRRWMSSQLEEIPVGWGTSCSFWAKRHHCFALNRTETDTIESNSMCLDLDNRTEKSVTHVTPGTEEHILWRLIPSKI